MRYFVPIFVAVGLAVAPALAIAQDTSGSADAVVKQPNGPVDAVGKVPGKLPTKRGGTDFATTKADADAKAHSAAKLSNKSFNEANQAQAAKATGGSVKSSIHNKNILKTGDINNTNYNENKLNNVTIGVPTFAVPVR